ncbi:radical SAM protein [Microlunatus endophyticus]|uniref:Radical SAM protein n=1 Tax=Microlunatus endophyticus TaxID=1716077 RepID=A0A917S899_9ACTN|nr:TIGR03936 family radical SAM-associated protein [Microlunatus endophyticus]GGL61413.1 radical SAM protein [Microlunatus endophyticus]
MAREQPEQQAPPVQRLRIRYAKRGRLRFTSHRDFSRAFERALRRAGIPMAYSSGFSPHPRISYATASPTGAASEAEYLEIALSAVCVPELVARELDAALPDGLDVLAVVEAGPGSLADQLTGSVWQIDLRDIEPDVVVPAVGAFLAADTAVTERMTKNGLRSFDARESVVSLRAEGTVLRLVARHLTPLVRPDDVLSAMARITPAFAPQNPLITRLEQGTLDATQQVVAPF